MIQLPVMLAIIVAVVMFHCSEGFNVLPRFTNPSTRPLVRINKSPLPYSKYLHARHPLFSASTEYSDLIVGKTLKKQPTVLSRNTTSNMAVIGMYINGEATQRAFDETLEVYNKELAKENPGMDKIPPEFLYRAFGQQNVNLICLSILGEDIDIQVERTGLPTVGPKQVINFSNTTYVPGSEVYLEVLVALRPEVEYRSGGYKGLNIRIQRNNTEQDPIIARDLALAKAILEVAVIKTEIPQILVNEKLKSSYHNFLLTTGPEGMTEESLMKDLSDSNKFDSFKDLTIDLIVDDVKLDIILEDIAIKEGINMSDEELNRQFKAIMQDYSRQTQEPQDLELDDVREQLSKNLLRTKVMDYLASVGHISYDDSK